MFEMGDIVANVNDNTLCGFVVEVKLYKNRHNIYGIVWFDKRYNPIDRSHFHYNENEVMKAS